MRFEHPNILWLLLVIPPAMILIFWLANRQKQKLLAQFVSARLLPVLTTGISPARQKSRFAFLILAVAFLIIALARPQHGFDLEEVSQNGLDIVVAVDTSKSMLTTDIAPNRLERAQLAALELMQRAGTDRMGLVAFAGNTFLECPLTIDNTAFQQSVQALNVNSIPQGGTAIAGAINTALTAFKEKGHYKALVLLTDGEDNEDESGALAAAKDAAKNGLKIFTIGIGTAAGDLIRVTDASGNSDCVRDGQGNVVKSHLNENLLQQIAGATGGFYLPLRGANTMDTLYERGLEPLPKSEGIARTLRRYHEQFQWPLAAAILLLLAEMFLPERKREKKNSASISSAAAKTALFVMVLCALPNLIFASPASALQDYKSGNFTNALTEFSRLAEIRTNDLRLVFNAGAAAYRATNYDEALKDFNLITLAPDLKLQQQAYYNLGNTQFQIARDAEDLNDLQTGLETAKKSYERAVMLNTNDLDAAFNLTFVQSDIEKIKQLRKILLLAKQQADDAVRRAEFREALEIMQKLKVKTKPLEDYTKKLKDIDAIAPPDQP
jgi:Ca-activated chloride channel family protein